MRTQLNGTQASRTAGGESAFLGISPAAERVRLQILMAAGTKAAVMITGESGVGKELVAREIHRKSSRADGPLVVQNCAAIPDSLFESEIFGHEAGAFTDAKAPRRGALERAHQGTLFLDEIGDLSLAAQPKLLRALEAGEILRLGGERPSPVDVRFVSATNHSLSAMRKERRFREDLYYRLCVIEIRVPPLRNRRDDVLALAEHFARVEMEAVGLRFERIASSSLPLLLAHPWRGNVRELRSVVERAIAVNPSPRLMVEASMLDVESNPALSLSALFKEDLKTARARFDAAYVAQILERNEHDVRKAAQAAGVVPRSLYKMLQRLGLRPGPPCEKGEDEEP